MTRTAVLKRNRIEPVLGLLLAAVAVALTMWGRLTFGSGIESPTLILFSMPIIFSAFLGGFWPGIFASLLSCAMADYFLIPPYHTFAVTGRYEIWHLSTLAISGVFISLICEVSRRSLDRSEQDRARLARACDQTAAFASIIETCSDAIISKDLDGRITSWNKASETVFGYSATEAIGAPISMLIPHALLAEELAILDKVKTGNASRLYETTRLRKDGSTIAVSVAVSPILDASGKVIGASKIARDITAKKESEAKAHWFQEEFAHVARLSAMGQMSAAIAHELNQPLAAIVNYTNAANRLLDGEAGRSPGIARARSALEKASIQAARAGTIIRYLRGFLEKRRSHKVPVDLNDVVEEAMALGFAGSDASGVNIHLVLGSGLKPVAIDQVQIQQVLINLIRNSIEAMAGCEKRELTVTTDQDTAFVRLIIHDTGPGLSDEVAGKLFQPFLTTKAHGMGIGLNLCQSIIQDHAGEIGVLEDGLPGTSFQIRLPVAHMPMVASA